MLSLLALAAVSAPADKVTFEQHVRPILKAYCLDCHGAEEKPKGKLDLRLRRFLATGGRNGPAFVPGKSTESLIIQRMISGEMPTTEKKRAVITPWLTI